MLQAVANKHSLVSRWLCDLHCMVVGKCFWHFARPAIFDSQLLDQNRDFCLYPTCIRRPRQGGSRGNIATPFVIEKLEWCGYLMVKKKFEDMFIRIDMIHTRDRRTDTAWRHKPRLCIASRGKKLWQYVKPFSSNTGQWRIQGGMPPPQTKPR